MKIIISDRDGKYYWKYDELGQCQCPFAKLLKRHGICALRYTITKWYSRKV